MFRTSASVAALELGSRRQSNRATSKAIGAALGLALLHCSGEISDPTNWERTGFPILAAAGQTTGPGSASGVSRAELVHVAGAAGVGGRVTASATVRLNEVKFDPPGNDGDYEFVELLGEPLTIVGRRWLVAIEGDRDANPGLIDLAIDLSRCADSPCQFDEQGLLVLAANLASVAATAWRESPELANGGLENGTTSLMVFEAPPENVLRPGTADWDTNDDGQLEIPNGWRILDSVSWADSTGDLSYASTNPLGPKPKPQALWRCRSAVGEDSWAYGQLLGEAPSLTADAANSIPPGMAAVTLSPGAPNQCPESATSSVTGLGGAPSPVLSNAGAPPVGLARAGATVIIGAGGSTASEVGVLSAPGLGGRSTAAPSATHWAGSESILVVNAKISTNQSGSTGWWSPNPFASLMGGTAAEGGASMSSLAPSKGGATGSPAMPSSCEVARMPVRRPTRLGLLWLAAALTRGCRRRCR